MGRKLIPIVLKEGEVPQLEQILRKGTHKSQEIRRAQILLRLHAGEKPTSISLAVNCSPATVKSVKRRYQEGVWKGR